VVDRLVVAGLAGLRWAVAQPLPDDDVYAGAAGVLRALAEAHLGGHRAFDKVALQLRDRLNAAPLGAESGLYVGIAGHVAALAAWAAASGDAKAAASAAEHARRLAAGPLPTSRDVINGQAGLLLVLVGAGERDSAARVADALATAAEPAPGGVQWRHTATATYLMPGLSHGTAGVVLALARAAALLERRDLLALARAGGQQLLVLGRRDDGTVALPLTVPPQPAPPHQGWGWCHGPTGTVQAFLALAAHDPAWRPALTLRWPRCGPAGCPNGDIPGSGTTSRSAAEPPVCWSSRSTATRPAPTPTGCPGPVCSPTTCSPTPSPSTERTTRRSHGATSSTADPILSCRPSRAGCKAPLG